MMPAELLLPFLGSRTYLHGTTLFDALALHAPGGAALTFKISRRIDSDRVRLEDRAGGGADASLGWEEGGRIGQIAAFAAPPSGALRREPYDEDRIARAASASGVTATLTGPSPFGFVQTLIPLFKLLLAGNVRPGSPGQWMFTRLDLHCRPGEFTPLTLRLSGVVPERLARARIDCAGDAAGEIYFSWASR